MEADVEVVGVPVRADTHERLEGGDAECGAALRQIGFVKREAVFALLWGSSETHVRSPRYTGIASIPLIICPEKRVTDLPGFGFASCETERSTKN